MLRDFHIPLQIVYQSGTNEEAAPLRATASLGGPFKEYKDIKPSLVTMITKISKMFKKFYKNLFAGVVMYHQNLQKRGNDGIITRQ